MNFKTVFLFLLLFSAGLAGCNTVEGLGEDLESAGRAIDDTAEETRKNN
jgi:predicted small secreted protein